MTTADPSPLQGDGPLVETVASEAGAACTRFGGVATVLRGDSTPADDGGRPDLVLVVGSSASLLPRLRGDHTFFAMRTIGRDHPALCVSHGDGDPIELVDPMRVDPSGGTTLEIWHPSVEGDLLAYQLAGGGTEESRLRVLDVAAGEVVDGPIDRVRRAPVAWLPGGQAYYYVRRLAPDLVPPTERRYHRRVYLHRVGTSPDDDVLIFGDGRSKPTTTA
jgi:prolyl oligopeptidase